MNNFRTNSLVPLTVKAADEGTEIFLIDSSFNRLKSDVGRLQAEVKPGIYKVRFRAGETQVDRFVEVPEAARRRRDGVEVSEEPLSFSSVAPIPGTRAFSTCHEAAWRRAWQCPDKSIGHGGSVFLMVRDIDSSDDCDSAAQVRKPWAGVTLTDTDGKILCAMSRDGLRDPCVGVGTLHAEVAPGTYVLRIKAAVSGSQCQKMAVVVCPGWQTQVVMAAERFRRSMKGGFKAAPRATLTDAAVFMVKTDNHEDPGEFMEKHLRLTELARQGLAQGRSPIRPGDMQEMLWAKFANPMLGIIGTHLLLRGPEPDWNMLGNVVSNLENIANGHPDIQALRFAVDAHQNIATPRSISFSCPPMLSASWRLVVEASARKPDLVPKGSLADRIGGGLIGGGPWLVWGRESPSTTYAGRKLDVMSDVLTTLSMGAGYGLIVRKIHRELEDSARETVLPPPPNLIQGDINEEPMEHLLADIKERFPVKLSRSGIVPYRRFPASQRALIQAVAAQCVSGSRVSSEQVVRRMGMPSTTVAGIARKLLRRKGHLGNAAGRMG